MYKEFFKELDTPIYQANIECTQTDAGGGNILLKLTAANGTRIMITHITLQTSVSGGLRLENYVYDSNNDLIQILGLDTSFAAGSILTYPSTGTAATNDNNITSSQYIVLTNGDFLQFRLSSAPQNTILKVRVRGFIRGRLPTRSTSGSGGSISTTVKRENIV